MIQGKVRTDGKNEEWPKRIKKKDLKKRRTILKLLRILSISSKSVILDSSNLWYNKEQTNKENKKKNFKKYKIKRDRSKKWN